MDPLERARAGVHRRRRAQLETAGRADSTEALAGRLGISRRAVDSRRRRGTLLALRGPVGTWHFPRAQFDGEGRPLPGLVDALRALNVEDPWMRLALLITPSADLGGRSALQVLREEGRDALPAVVRSVAIVGEHAA